MAVRVSVSEMARDGVKDKQGKKRGKVQTPEPPFWTAYWKHRWKLQRQTYAMEKSLANGGLATIASMIKKMLWTEKACARNKPGRKGIEMSNSFLGTSLCLGR